MFFDLNFLLMMAALVVASFCFDPSAKIWMLLGYFSLIFWNFSWNAIGWMAFLLFTETSQFSGL